MGKLEAAFNKISRDLVTDAAMETESEVKLNLSGRALNIGETGNLISGSHAIVTQDTGKGHESAVVSSAQRDGFHYGVYWEYEGNRPFMRPAADVVVPKVEQKAILKLSYGLVGMLK